MGGGLAGMGAGWRRGRGHGGVQTITLACLSNMPLSGPIFSAFRRGEKGTGMDGSRGPENRWSGLPYVRKMGTVDVSWTRLSAVRAAAGGTYLLVAGAIVISFAVAAFVTDRGVRRVG